MIPYKTIFGIATVMSFRMVGLFMVMPLLALYVTHLTHTTPFLIGIALGIYGLTQACFQIPFGIISDFRDRKAVIIVGLLLFIVGSLMAALAHSIYIMIAGRALQGSAAIGSTLMALVSDVTAEKDRSQAMALVGGVIGLSFSISIVLGPALNTWFSVSSIFVLSAFMGIAAIGVLFITIPQSAHQNEKPIQFSLQAVLSSFRQISHQKQLLQYNFYSMLIHMILILNFIGVPSLLDSGIHIAQQAHWKIYLPILMLSFAVTLGWIMLLKKKEGVNNSMLLAVGLIIISQIVLTFFASYLMGILIGLLLFFIGFNFLEATLPSEISKKVNTEHRGMAMGLYSTTQFMGVFLGGLLGGIVSSTHLSSQGVFMIGILLATIWFILMAKTASRFTSLQIETP